VSTGITGEEFALGVERGVICGVGVALLLEPPPQPSAMDAVRIAIPYIAEISHGCRIGSFILHQKTARPAVPPIKHLAEAHRRFRPATAAV
jgi:hypothetical protein